MEWLPSIKALLNANAKLKPLESCIDPHERVVFFPTVACKNARHWHLAIHGWIYKPSELSRLRRVGLHLVKRALRLKVKRSDPRMPLVRKRLGALLADNNRGQRLRVKLGDAVFTLAKSRANGHFKATLDLPHRHVADLLKTTAHSPAGDWLAFRAITRAHDPRIFDGRILILPEHGLSVISDIDDTIKITEVTDRRRLLHNTFLNAFASVPEMPALYQRWQRDLAASFHYVSASPWHLYPCLSEFLHAQNFPLGTFHMRTFRLAGRDLATAFRSSRRVKSLHIKHLLECFPHRRFILVGDSGESDPDMYAHFYRHHPHQIQKILIRNITADPPDSPRWPKTFARIPRNKFQIFTTPDELL